jgi:hypothetical protein
VVATAVLAVLLGVLLCVAIVRAVARRCGLPIRETLMWFGLLELDSAALARAARRPERR